MGEFVLLTAVGRDRPGIVAAVSEALWRAGCNLEDASMTLLRGEFAVLLIAKRPPELTTEALASQLQALADRSGLQIMVKELSPQESESLPRVGRPYAIHIYGEDRTGIVHQISSLLAARGVNITDVNTRVLTGSGTLLVYPRTVPLPNFTIPGGELSGESRVKTRTHAVTPNAAGIREYVPGDSFNRIHWPSTARTGRIMVKEFELDPSSEVWLVIDMEARVQAGEGDESTEEYAVTIAASIGRRLVEMNRSVGLIAAGETHEVVHTDRGDRQLQKLLETLALVRAIGRASLAEVIAAESSRFGRNSTLVVITPSTEQSWVDDLQHQTHRGVRAVAVVLEPATFGGSSDVLPILGTLAIADIRTFLIKCGDDLNQALTGGRRQRLAS
ncbi:MAG: DUF58 domain-containing protein [Chloroflexi bacterium]|nr:DUF58 domain-containing protein [Chloroflexota bacterium]